ncbi:MAG TPA: AAA family ATPase, partial [Terriglobales bacterium]|nr:AAA family ATPase [Terriglobales bacterium]
MSRGLLEPPPTSFHSIFEPTPFYTTLHYQEVLATLRYGIVARKGLMLLIGDAGIGKSTLLEQLGRELNTDIDCIVGSDPDLDFSDLLRLVLDTLEGVDNADDDLAMLQRCKHVLHSRLEAGRIVALMVDNAEHLACETLEQLLNNFRSAALADQDDNLLQIVLAGRSELKNHLAQARLHSLIPRAEIVCQLQPLRDKDITVYLQTRLQAANLPEKTFDNAAIDLIAVYSGGNPHWINRISNRALQVSHGSPDPSVSAEMVDYAARSLGLSEG